MQTALAWPLVAIVILAAYPWSKRLLAWSPHPPEPSLPLLLTLALSSGTLTLIMFWESILGIPLSLAGVTLPYLTLMLPGWYFWWRTSPGISAPTSLTSSADWRLPKILLALISGAILLNAVYWPFYRDDAVAIYHRYGKLMYETGALVPFVGRDEAFYQAYPMQIPLAYTYAYLAAGWVNEYLARSIAALLALACLGVVFILGKHVYGVRAGWLSALLLAFTPAFARWSSSGYVDLPMAFFYALAALFAWRLITDPNPTDALLTGIALGLAAWTKNAALFGVMLVASWLVIATLKRQMPLKWVLLVLGVTLAIAAPWYIRNWLEARLIVPSTAWTEQAGRTITNLLVFITQPENFGLVGWLILVSLGALGLGWWRGTPNRRGETLILWLTLPFFAIWWLLVSYDPRFVLLFFPLLTVLAGSWCARMWTDLPHRWQRRTTPLLSLVALALTMYIVWISVEFKTEVLRAPLMSDETKHLVVGQERER